MTTRGELARGTRLGKYEIHGRLSVGGMAELYLASLAGQGGFRKFVALKRVLPSIASDESFKAMFLDEARITASLSHAGIAQVFELAEDPDTREPVLAMEFVAGQNLEQLVQRARKRSIELPLEFSCRLATDVLLALHYAHGFVDPATGSPNPVVHRDINPRNVMVTYAGGTKIIDFGIAKARGRLNQTSAGFVKGTLQYMAPEQVTARGADSRTDLFAASILLWELLTGRVLFDAPSPAATMSKVMTEPIPDLSGVEPPLPQALVDAVMKGLERDPARRWQNGREYARAIDRAVPDTFDEQQMAELMASLFEDKIAVTRALLSSAGEASASDLRLMTMMGDEEPRQRELASDVVPVSERTAIARPPTREQAAAKGRPPTREQPKAAPAPVETSQETEANLPPVVSSSPFADSEKTIAALPVTPSKPRSRPQLAKTGPAPKESSLVWLYVVLGLLAVALTIGTVLLLRDDEPVPAQPLRRSR